MTAVAKKVGTGAYYTLGLMSLVYLFNFMDRLVLSMLLPGIKADFHLTDFHLGILMGPAFALVYAALGIPIAILGDRFNRRNLVAGSVLLFSAMTAFCGYATSFLQLIIGRIGIGIGMAGTAPSVNSMISDLFPKEKRAGALGIFVAGANLGMLFATFGGGWVALHYGWRTAFIWAGLPGILLALLFYFTVQEPKRGAIDAVSDTKPLSFWQGTRTLLSRPSYCWLVAAVSFFTLGANVLTIYAPLFLVRSHGMSLPEAGLITAILFGAFGAAGTTIVGFALNKFAEKDIRWLVRWPAYFCIGHVPFTILFLLTDNYYLMLIGCGLPAAVGGSCMPASYAAIQSLAPLRARAIAPAFILFVLSIVGLALGPLMIGSLTVYLEPQFGNEALRYALLICAAAAFIGGLCYFLAARTFKADIARASE